MDHGTESRSQILIAATPTVPPVPPDRPPAVPPLPEPGVVAPPSEWQPARASEIASVANERMRPASSMSTLLTSERALRAGDLLAKIVDVVGGVASLLGALLTAAYLARREQLRFEPHLLRRRPHVHMRAMPDPVDQEALVG